MTNAPHDLLALNSDSSKDYRKAREEFENFYNDESNMVEMSTDASDMLNTGFEYGFWAAAKILTGFKHEYDRD
jgi:hypothetical protein